MNSFLSLQWIDSSVMEDAQDFADFQKAFIFLPSPQSISFGHFTNLTANKGSDITGLSSAWPARFGFDSHLKYSVKNVSFSCLANEWSLQDDKQAS